MNTTINMTVANTIKEQLGRVTLAMLGAHDLVGDHDHLQLKIKGSKRCNVIVIRLAADDTYTVRFSKYSPLRFSRKTFLPISGGEDKEIALVEGVYVDRLHAVIEAETGLYTTMSRAG